MVSWSEQIKGGKVRALAVTSATRTKLLPDLPPIGEFVPGYEGFGWQGIGAPKNTPADVIDKLNRETVRIMTLPEKLEGIGIVPLVNTPAEFGALIKKEADYWAQMVKNTGIKPIE